MNAASGGRPVSFRHVEAALELLGSEVARSVDVPGHTVERLGPRLVLTSSVTDARGRTRASSNFFEYPLSIPGEVPLLQAGCLLAAESCPAGTDPRPLTPGASTAALQRTAYPDIAPIALTLPPAEAFKRVDRVAMALGWDVVARAPAEGRLEAVDTTDWFGLQDDIVVRIRAEGTTGSRIDIRSKSRLGESDFGANAQRIRAFMERLRAEQ